MVFVTYPGMRRSTRMTSQTKPYRPEEKQRRGRKISIQSVPNFISVEERTAGTAAGGACAMNIEDNTMMSSIGSPVAESRRSQEGNKSNSNILLGDEAEEDDGSSTAHDEEMGWDDGEPVNLEQESYAYTEVSGWNVW